ncbi:ribosome small subunit-dependent GTPase A, partial [Patescibacteria group bacterium]|nr:ribosome small subunit-dependent GTPase A [Patescibacteria group bacterium]
PNASGLMPIGLIASVYGGAASVLLDGKTHEATAPVSLLTQLTVGDRVSLDPTTTPIRILSIEPRRTELARTKGEGGSRHHKQKLVIAANIDVAIIVATATNPAFEPELVDRYLILCRAANIEPIICLNKVDLTAERHPALDWYRSQNIPVIETSPKINQGIAELQAAIRSKIGILLGKSGAGKSSLINILTPGANVETKEVSGHAQQGQHTTTRSNIHIWAPDSYIIDTPGIRTLDVEHVDDDDITLGFPDILGLSHNCHFSNCQHNKEPGCAVQEALIQKILPTWRWESYRDISEKIG